MSAGVGTDGSKKWRIARKRRWAWRMLRIQRVLCVCLNLRTFEAGRLSSWWPAARRS